MKRLFASVAALSLFALTACQSTSGNITLGFVGPLTGDAAAIGIDVLNAAKMKIEEVNAKGGIAGKIVSIIAEDGKCTAAEAANAFQKILNVDKVNAVVGGLCSGETLAGAPIAEAAKIVMLSPGSSSPKVTDAGEFTFRNYPSDSFKGIAMAKYFKQKGWTKVAIITQNTDYATGIRDSVTANVGKDNVVFSETVEESTKDFRTLLGRLKDIEFDVFVPAMQTDGVAGAIIAQYKEQGLTKPIVGADVMESVAVSEIAGKAAEGAEFVNTPTVGAGTPFEKGFVEKYGTPKASISWAAYGYDAAGVLLQVMAEKGMDGTAMRDALYALKGYDGVIGNFHFDKKGDVVGAKYVVKEFKDGKIVTVQDLAID